MGKREELLADAIAAGYSVSDDGAGGVNIVRRHAGNGSILQGIWLSPSGTAIDATVRLDVAKGLRSYAAMRRVLGLKG